MDRARELARQYLRRSQPFVWNATNTSRELRSKLIDLFALYNARVRIVYVEVPQARLFAQNRAREAAVPEPVIEKLLRHWEVPDLTEAHELAHAVPAQKR